MLSLLYPYFGQIKRASQAYVDINNTQNIDKLAFNTLNRLLTFFIFVNMLGGERLFILLYFILFLE